MNTGTAAILPNWSAAKPVDDVLVEDRDDDVDPLRRHQEHHRGGDTEPQRRLSRRPKVRQQRAQRAQVAGSARHRRTAGGELACDVPGSAERGGGGDYTPRARDASAAADRMPLTR